MSHPTTYNWISTGPDGCDNHCIAHPCGPCITGRRTPEAPQVPAISPPDDDALDCSLTGECDESGETDIDLCRACGEHAAYCSQCGLSNCCGSRPYMP